MAKKSERQKFHQGDFRLQVPRQKQKHIFEE